MIFFIFTKEFGKTSVLILYSVMCISNVDLKALEKGIAIFIKLFYVTTFDDRFYGFTPIITDNLKPYNTNYLVDFVNNFILFTLLLYFNS
jgi:hypothetical protein